MDQTPDIFLTPVEKTALRSSAFKAVYPPEEHLPAIVVDNFPALGRLTALRFLEWVQANPGGVVSLPTGKTPEHFIAWTQRLLNSWDSTDTRAVLEEAGIDPGIRPDTRSLHFVQIDEFYPIHPTQHNSFYYYVNKYYVDGLGLDPAQCLLMDCSRIGLDHGLSLDDVWPDRCVDLTLRVRPAATALEARQKDALARVDEFCMTYEDRIRQLGGIGFFLGGIGPDGHIGFNVRGSDHHSTTRLTETNYETQAAAASDLGGVDVSRNRLVITIGLGTIRHNPDCAAVIIAAGEAKAPIVARAIQGPQGIEAPASALYGMPNARFYLTQGAACLLKRRQLQLLSEATAISDSAAARVLVDTAVRVNKPLAALDKADVAADPLGAALLEKRGELEALLTTTRQSMVDALERGAQVRENTRFLHTEPHHDDIMLGYLPAVVRHVRVPTNEHHFVTLTSGFTAVTNAHMLSRLERLRGFIHRDDFEALMREGYFDPSNREARNRDVWQYLDGVTARDSEMRNEGDARRQLRDLVDVFQSTSLDNLADRIKELVHYFESEYPGKKDLEHIQQLKGMCREWEAECLWGYFGWNTQNVSHLRLGFYTGDIFTEEPTITRDVEPLVSLLSEVNPDVVTMALDPEGSGPDTHYKVLQVLSEALRIHAADTGRNDIRVWGYRNVWFHFHPSETNLYIPVSLNMFAIMENAFMNTFISQKDAPFPSHEHDGPFCELAQAIQSRQYQTVKTCLGREWFHGNPRAMFRATRGLVFVQEMTLDDLQERCRELRRAAENVGEGGEGWEDEKMGA